MPWLEWMAQKRDASQRSGCSDMTALQVSAVRSCHFAKLSTAPLRTLFRWRWKFSDYVTKCLPTAHPQPPAFVSALLLTMFSAPRPYTRPVNSNKSWLFCQFISSCLLLCVTNCLHRVCGLLSGSRILPKGQNEILSVHFKFLIRLG